MGLPRQHKQLEGLTIWSDDGVSCPFQLASVASSGFAPRHLPPTTDRRFACVVLRNSIVTRLLKEALHDLLTSHHVVTLLGARQQPHGGRCCAAPSARLAVASCSTTLHQLQQQHAAAANGAREIPVEGAVRSASSAGDTRVIGCLGGRPNGGMLEELTKQVVTRHLPAAAASSKSKEPPLLQGFLLHLSGGGCVLWVCAHHGLADFETLQHVAGRWAGAYNARLEQWERHIGTAAGPAVYGSGSGGRDSRGSGSIASEDALCRCSSHTISCWDDSSDDEDGLGSEGGSTSRLSSFVYEHEGEGEGEDASGAGLRHGAVVLMQHVYGRGGAAGSTAGPGAAGGDTGTSNGTASRFASSSLGVLTSHRLADGVTEWAEEEGEEEEGIGAEGSSSRCSNGGVSEGCSVPLRASYALLARGIGAALQAWLRSARAAASVAAAAAADVRAPQQHQESQQQQVQVPATYSACTEVLLAVRAHAQRCLPSTWALAVREAVGQHKPCAVQQQDDPTVVVDCTQWQFGAEAPLLVHFCHVPARARQRC